MAFVYEDQRLVGAQQPLELLGLERLRARQRRIIGKLLFKPGGVLAGRALPTQDIMDRGIKLSACCQAADHPFPPKIERVFLVGPRLDRFRRGRDLASDATGLAEFFGANALAEFSGGTGLA
jgi:hypothetical protein